MADPKYNIALAPHRRGTEFRYSSELGNGWTEAMFTGGLLFTIRRRIPESSVLDDAGAVAQASLSDGITFTSDTEFTILIPDTQQWPTGQLFWDLQGKVTDGARVLDVAAGTVAVAGDVTRS